MTAQQLTIEATALTDSLWFARLNVEKQMETENDTNKVVDLITKWTRIQDAENKALERMARRLTKQVENEKAL